MCVCVRERDVDGEVGEGWGEEKAKEDICRERETERQTVRDREREIEKESERD